MIGHPQPSISLVAYGEVTYATGGEECRVSNDFSGEAHTVVPIQRNDFSGEAHTVVQIQQMIGDIVTSVPAQKPRVPRQLRPADALFIDRAVPLKVMIDGPLAGAGTGVHVVVVSGPEGVGKSALSRVACGLAPQFPGGELWVDVRSVQQYADGPALTGEMLAHCLRSLGATAIPEKLHERRAMLQTWTAGQPVLLVLDGVTEPAQIEDLLPRAAGSVVLATVAQPPGRFIARGGAVSVKLDSLDESDARALLAAMVGDERVDADPAATTALIEICGGLPAGLRTVGGWLADFPSLTVRELVEDLEPDGDDRLESLVAAVYDQLPVGAQNAFCLLGAVPLPTFTAVSVAALLGGEQAAGLSAVMALHSRYLAVDLPARRFRMPERGRRAARRRGRRLPSAQVGEAVARLLDCFTMRALFADQLLLHPDRLRLVPLEDFVVGQTSPFADAAAAQDWVDDEWPALMVALDHGARSGHAEGVWQLAEVIAALSLNRRSSSDLIKLCEIGVKAAAVEGRVDVQARLNALASRGFLDLGDLPAAKRVLQTALEQAEAAGNLLLLASVWEFWGRYLEQSGHRGEAADAYRNSLRLNETAGDRRGAALAAFFLAGVTDREPVTEYERLLRVFGQELADERMAARVGIRLGAGYAAQGAPDRAVPVLDEAIQVLLRRNATHYAAEALQVLADIAEQLGDPAGAHRALAKAADLLAARGNPRHAPLLQRLAALEDRGIIPESP
ncbi:NB-ARC domain-containing protein [Actinoplanes sp. NPDC026670]|uniref:NB-ARC domain-containing protein n=1 Tax=Actinoplanes sp. NPDC026670 TaxID=3154700 RepID=UPI0033E8E739